MNLHHHRMNPCAHNKGAPPPREWTGQYAPKRVRKFARLRYRSRASEYSAQAAAALKEGKTILAEGFAKLAGSMAAKARALFGRGGSFKTNQALRRAN